MRFLLCALLLSYAASAQNCSPENLEAEKRKLNAGDYQKKALLEKLQGLAREIHTLSTAKYEEAQKNAMRHCLQEKDILFQTLMNRPEPTIQDSAAYQEVMSDFYRLHHDPRQALVHMEAAVKINSKSIPLLVKDFKLFQEVEGIQLKELSGKPIAVEENKRVLIELSRRAERIATHPQAGKAYVIDALTHQAVVAKLLKNFPQEMQYWEKILAIDPRNVTALQNRFTYYYAKKQIPETTETMRRLVRDSIATDENWIQFLGMLAANEKWEELTSWTKRSPEKLAGQRPELLGHMARAQIELGRKAEAERIMAQLPKKLTGKAAELAAGNQARLREIDADTLRAQGRLSEALDEYKQALPASPRPLSVKEKMSHLIYEYRKGLNFLPAEGTRADLEEVTKLLETSVYQTELKSNLFSIYLHSLSLLKKPAELAKACTRYRELYPELVRSKDYQPYCQ